MTRILRTVLTLATSAAAIATSASAQAPATNTPPRAGGPTELFRTALADAPGNQPASPGHRHPGSVYVYVTEGTARLGVEGEPVKEVKTGESFFEAPGALHNVMESASATAGAKAIAVMIVPDGAPLTLPAH